MHCQSSLHFVQKLLNKSTALSFLAFHSILIDMSFFLQVCLSLPMTATCTEIITQVFHVHFRNQSELYKNEYKTSKFSINQHTILYASLNNTTFRIWYNTPQTACTKYNSKKHDCHCETWAPWSKIWEWLCTESLSTGLHPSNQCTASWTFPFPLLDSPLETVWLKQ